MKTYTITEINENVNRDAAGFVKACEESYVRQILGVAERLRDGSAERPVALLSGPSGSGKTTTAHLLEQILDSWGCETHTISMDNYFLPRDEGPMPVDENGRIDLESPLRLDSGLLCEHLRRLSAGGQVEMPVFDFENQCRRGHRTISRERGELLIFEGIHALNPDVTGQVHDIASHMYVSVRTRVQNSRGGMLHPSKIRLARRLIRDRLTRGYSFDDTVANFHSVSRGEGLYIMPHRHRAGIDIDTFFPYELSVYASLLQQELCATGGLRDELSELYAFVREVIPLDEALIPDSSLVREFIGGSVFG